MAILGSTKKNHEISRSQTTPKIKMDELKESIRITICQKNHEEFHRLFKQLPKDDPDALWLEICHRAAVYGIKNTWKGYFYRLKFGGFSKRKEFEQAYREFTN